MKYSTVFAIILLTSTHLISQSHSCGFDQVMDNIKTDEVIKNKILSNQKIISKRIADSSASNTATRTTQYTLPVIVHVMEYQGNSLITDEAIITGLQRLTSDFNSETSANIDFCPAKRSPDNTPVNGVNRIDCLTTYCGKYSANGLVNTYGSETAILKSLSTWLPTDYINIWVVNDIQGQGGNTLGFSSFPNTIPQHLEGIVIDYHYFNTSVLTHEIGHYLGLYHTFEGTAWGCIDADDCTLTGDLVCDTAPHLKQHTCTSVDQSNMCCDDGCLGLGSDFQSYAYNYMSYSKVECLSKFTPGQTDRMRAHVETFYNSLTYSNGCYTPCSSDVVTLDGPLNIIANETNSYHNTTEGSINAAWYLDGKSISNYNTVEVAITEQGLHTLCLFTTVDECPQDHCETIYVIDNLTSCDESTQLACDSAINGDFESALTLEDNISYIQDAYHYSQYSQEWDKVCNWYNRVSSPLYCTSSESGKFMLGINYDNRESIGMVKPLNLEVGKEYTVSLDYSVYSYNNIEVPLDYFRVGLSHTVYQSNAPGNNSDLIKVSNPPNEPILYKPSDFCSYDPRQTATVTFTYSDEMGQYLFIEGVDDNSRNRLIIDNIAIKHCELDCTAPFTTTQESECTIRFDGSTDTQVLSCMWDFGDGHSAQGIQASHSYSQSGNYEICMTRECAFDNQIICQPIEINVLDNEEYVTAELSSEITTDGIEISYTLCNTATHTIDDLEVTLSLPTGLSMLSSGGMIQMDQELHQTLGLSTGCQTLQVNCEIQETCPCDVGTITANILYESTCKTIEQTHEEVIQLQNSSHISLDYTVAFTCSEALITLTDPSPCVEYIWTFGDNNSMTGTHISYDFITQGVHTFDLSAVHNCGMVQSEAQTLTVNCETPSHPCDLPDDAIIFTGDASISDYINTAEVSPHFTQKTFYVDSILRLDTEVSFSGCILYFAENAEMIIDESESEIKFTGTTLTACDQRWQGIELSENTKVQLKFGTIISNATIGIKASNGVDKLLVYRSKFENNITAAYLSSCDHQASVVFDEVGIYTQSDDNLTGTNGITVESNDNFVYIRRSHFSNLNTAVSIDNARVDIRNACSFNNIGLSRIADNEEDSSHPSSAIVAINHSYLNVASGNSFDCISGITLNQSTGNITNNRFDVEREAILGAFDQSGLLHISHNSIVSAQRGVDLVSVTHPIIFDNTITIDNTADQSFGSGIILSNDIGGEISANLISLSSGRSGIVINNHRACTLQDNTLVNGIENKSNTIGIHLVGGAGHTIGCNTISSLTDSAMHTGISMSMSNTNSLIQNEFENLHEGLSIKEMSDNQSLRCNKFISGNIGMSIGSNIGTQKSNSNQWMEGAWTEADITTLLSSDALALMQFQSNSTGYPYTPSNVSANGDIFDTQSDRPNTPCTNCIEMRNDYVSEQQQFIDNLCTLINNDANSSTYLENLQLLKLIATSNTNSSYSTCIEAFLKRMKTKAEQKYITVNTLVTSTDAETMDKISRVNEKLKEALSHQNSSVMNSASAEVKQLQSQLSLYRTMHTFNAINLNSEVKAKTDISAKWKKCYTTALDLMNKSTLRPNQKQYQLLHEIAIECPSDLGSIVYMARDILSRITRVDYSQYDCKDTIITTQNTAIASDTQVIERSHEKTELNEISIEVYPNPTSDYLNLSLPSTNNLWTINIYSADGSRVKNMETTSSTESIAVDTWESGIYIIQALHDNDYTLAQVIIN